MFELVKEKLALGNVNVRLEKHGDENVNAYDLKFTGNFANAVLLKFDAKLRDLFYTVAAQSDVEEDFYPQLRFPLLGPVTWDLEVPRTKLRLHDIDDDAHDLVLSDGKTNKFAFEMLEGGTVKLSFRVQFSELDEDDVAKLLRANGQTVPVSLECEPLEAKPDNYEQADLLTQEPHSAARAEAESLFSAPPTDMAISVDAGNPAGDQTATALIQGDDVVDATYTPPTDPAPEVVEPAAPRRGRPRKAAVEIE